MPEMEYNAEQYWDEIAGRITQQKTGSFLAGDNEPYYQHKRNLFLQLLHTIPVKNKKVLEVGSGPGGNLLEISKSKPARLTGVDISGQMIELSSTRIKDTGIEVVKINGESLPFGANEFDIVFTVTVLQHITDDGKAASLVRDMCRVTSQDIYIFERIERKKKKFFSNTGRTVNEYVQYFNAGGFLLEGKRFLPLRTSYAVCGAIRKVFNRRTRKEGEKLSSLSVFLQKLTLPLTRQLDKIISPKRDLAMLHFKREDQL